jgi:hypothetical protein
VHVTRCFSSQVSDAEHGRFYCHSCVQGWRLNQQLFVLESIFSRRWGGAAGRMAGEEESCLGGGWGTSSMLCEVPRTHPGSKTLGSSAPLVPPSCDYRRQAQGTENEVSGDPWQLTLFLPPLEGAGGRVSAPCGLRGKPSRQAAGFQGERAKPLQIPFKPCVQQKSAADAAPPPPSLPAPNPRTGVQGTPCAVRREPCAVRRAPGAVRRAETSAASLAGGPDAGRAGGAATSRTLAAKARRCPRKDGCR